MSRVISTHLGRSNCTRRGGIAGGGLCCGEWLHNGSRDDVWTFGVFLDGVDVYGEDSGSVVS